MYIYIYIYIHIYICRQEVIQNGVTLVRHEAPSRIFMRVCVCVCVYIHINVCVYVYVFIHIYIYTYVYNIHMYMYREQNAQKGVESRSSRSSPVAVPH